MFSDNLVEEFLVVYSCVSEMVVIVLLLVVLSSLEKVVDAVVVSI